MKALHEVQQNALEQMWRVLVYEKFGKRPVGRKDAFTRQRELALSLPMDRSIHFSEVAALTPELTTAYANATQRMILRDLTVLANLELIIREPGLIRANGALLAGTLPNRRRIVAPRREASVQAQSAGAQS